MRVPSTLVGKACFPDVFAVAVVFAIIAAVSNCVAVEGNTHDCRRGSRRGSRRMVVAVVVVVVLVEVFII